MRYIAIGAAGTRPTSIGHYCVLAERYDRAGVAQALRAAGHSTGSGGPFAMLPDPDGLELQLFQPPAGLVTAAVPSPLPVEGEGLVRPVGVDHVLLHVTDVEASLPYYHLVYGAGIRTTRQSNPDRLWLQLAAETRIGLQRAPSGQQPRIDHYGIKVEPFDRNPAAGGRRRVCTCSQVCGARRGVDASAVTWPGAKVAASSTRSPIPCARSGLDA